MRTVNKIHRNSGYSIVPNSTLRDSRLSFRARGVLMWVLSHTDEFYVTKAEIEAAGKEGSEAITSAFAELEALGYRRVERRQGEGGRWTTTVHWHAEVVSPQVAPIPGFPGIGEPGVGEPGDREKNQREEPNTSPPPLATANRAGDAVEERKALDPVKEEFETFYSTYPRRVGKPRALAAYRQARKKAEAQVILAGLRRYVAWLGPKPDLTYVKHPSTWLNQEGWADELPARRGSPTAIWDELLGGEPA